MERIIRIVVYAVMCLSVLAALTRAANLPYDLDLSEYSPEDIEEAMKMLDDVPMKRAMCRPGFTYQSILRDCVPSLGALRGRGRNGRRGRRGLRPWSSWRS